MHWNQKLWQHSVAEFPEFLEPLVAELGRSERREGAAPCVQGLLIPGERKSIEPMAARLGADSQKLQQFIADSPWDEQELWRAIRREVVPVMEPLAAWIVDETGWLKQGQNSVGVAHQYCGGSPAHQPPSSPPPPRRWANKPTARSAWRWWSVMARSPRRWPGGSICRKAGRRMKPGARRPARPRECSFKPSPSWRWHCSRRFWPTG